MILGLETSCDETAAAVITEHGEIRSNVVASQAELHARFGGVVPEVASRRHLELVSPVVREALDRAGVSLFEIDRVAVTRGPGLIGALLVGLAAAKGIAWGRAPASSKRRSTTCTRARRVAVPAKLDSTSRATVPLPARELKRHTLLLDACRTRAGGSRGGWQPDGAVVRARGGVRLAGARLLGLGYPGRRRGSRQGVAQDGDPAAYDSRSTRVQGLGFLVLRSKTALPTPSRRSPGGGWSGAAAYWRRRTSARPQRLLKSGQRRTVEELGAVEVAIVGGVAANELRSALRKRPQRRSSPAPTTAAMIARPRGTCGSPPATPPRLDAYAVA